MPFTVGQYLTANDLNSQEDAHTLGYGVVNGLKVVPTDPVSMHIEVETGKAYVADTLVEKGAVTDLTVSAADPTNPRKDIVVCNSAGTLSIVAGTPEAALPSGNVGVYTLNPEPPSIPANSIILGEIWVAAGAASITGSEIYDKRVFTVGRLDLGRMPDMALDKVMVGQGAGVSPVEGDPIPKAEDESGSFAYTTGYSTTETDISALFTTPLTGTARRKYAILLNLTNFAADANFDKVYVAVKAKVDGTNYRAIDRKTIVKADLAATAEPGVPIMIPAVAQDVQITFQLNVALAANRVIYYHYVKEFLE